MLFTFSVILYGNTLFNDYNLDDELVTMNHRFTSKGLSAINDIFTSPYYEDEMGYKYEYRPIVHASFALEHELFGESPMVSHLVNLLLYALTIIVLFLVLQALLNTQGLMFVILTSLLFAAHPIHTEVVASIKNRDELLVLFFGLLSLWSAIKFIDRKNFLFLLPYVGLFLLAMLSKRSALALAIIIPSALVLFRNVAFWQVLVLSLPLSAIVYPLSPIYVNWVRVLLATALPGVPLTIYALWHTKALEAFTNSLSKLFGKVPIVVNKLSSGVTNSSSIIGKSFGKLISAVGSILSFKVLSISSVMAILLVLFEMLGILIGVLTDIDALVVSGLLLWNYQFFFTRHKLRNWLPLLYMMMVAGLAVNYNFYNAVYILAAANLVLLVFYGKYKNISNIAAGILGLGAVLYLDAQLLIVIALLLLMYQMLVRWQIKYAHYAIWAYLAVLILMDITATKGGLLYLVFPMAVYELVYAISLMNKRAVEQHWFSHIAFICAFLAITVNLAFYPPPSSNLLHQKQYIKVYTQITQGSSYIAQFLPGPRAEGDSAYVPIVEAVVQPPRTNNADQTLLANDFRKIEFVENPIPYLVEPTKKYGTMVNTLGEYARMLTLPYPLRYYYGYDQVSVISIWSARGVFYLVVYLSLLVILGVALVKRKRLLSLAMLILLVALVPFSNIFSPVAGIVGERLAYIPSLGFCLVLVWLLFKAFGLDVQATKLSELSWRVKLVFGAILLIYGLITVNRNFDWKDRFTLFRSDMPDLLRSAQANNLMAHEYAKLASSSNLTMQYEMAAQYFANAVAIEPNFFNAHYDLGRINLTLGKDEEALEQFLIVTKMDSAFTTPALQAAMLLDNMGRPEEALPLYEQVIRITPYKLQAYTSLSYMYYVNGYFEESVFICQLGMQSLPQEYSLYVNATRGLMELGDIPQAKETILKANDLRPNDPEVLGIMQQLGI